MFQSAMSIVLPC